MPKPRRGVIAGLFALALLAAAAGPTWAGPQGDEPLVFELTLSGDVNPEHTFGVAHECDDTDVCQFIEDLSIFCTGDEQQREDWATPYVRPAHLQSSMNVKLA